MRAEQICLECGGSGVLACDPDGETAYCEDCAKGLTKAIRDLEWHLEIDATWLARHQALGQECGREQLMFDCELAEHERLERLLRKKRREEFWQVVGIDPDKAVYKC